MLKKFTKRIISFLAAAAMAVCDTVPVFSVSEDPDSGLVRQSIELYPNGEDSEQVVTLAGLMPEGAEAEAVDVSGAYDGIAAYDITINDGDDEFQPDRKNPIRVEISDPAITDSEGLQLWHIKDSGERERILDFSASEGRICFFASGFSVYEIVDDVVSIQDDIFFDVLAQKGDQGFYVSFLFGGKDKPGVDPGVANNGQYYLKGTSKTINNQGSRKGIDLTSKNDTSGAVKVYFEKVSNQANSFYIYILDGDDRKYIKMYTGTDFGNGGTSAPLRSAIDYTDDPDEKTPFVFDHGSNTDARYKIYALLSDNKNHYWVPDDKSNVKDMVGYQASNDRNSAWITIHGLNDDSLELNGKSYALMKYDSGSFGTALVADTNNSRVYQIIARNSNGNRELFIPSGSDITEWTFENVFEDNYRLKANNGKYLTVTDGAVSYTSSSQNAAAFKVNPQSDNSILLSFNDKYIYFDGTNYTLSSSGTPLKFVSKADVGSDQEVTYSAHCISVSDTVNAGDESEVIVYTRIWDDDEKKYYYYAIDHDGSLKQCYQAGSKLMWLDDAMNTLLWKLTVYKYDNGEENGYYELRNTYSGKYICPQKGEENILSDDIIGIQFPGRLNGEYYSDIIAWDNDDYEYGAIKGKVVKDDEGNVISANLISTYFTDSDKSFYFAVLDSVVNEATEGLHTVETVDNNEYGIKMKMIDFKNRLSDNTYTGMSNFLGDNSGGLNEPPKQGLLSTKLGDDGYPTTALAASTNTFSGNTGAADYVPGRSLGDLLGNKDNKFAASSEQEVNHLFIDSIHESSGYFEFDSCQNTATLVQANGTIGSDFTVYKELATDNKSGKTHEHGQFYPFNTIYPGVFSETNPKNMYDALGNKLADSDPRKYEKLYLLNGKVNGKVTDPNYYNGLEMEAKFVQTPNGKDDWGHDVIFEFTGDDDFWLYVDGELIIDLGGIHSALAGNVNFATGDVVVNGVRKTLRQVFTENYMSRNPEASQDELNTFLADYFDGDETVFKDYTEHTMKVFYFERGAGASNLHMRFNLSSVTEGNVLFAKTVSDKDGHKIQDPDFDLSTLEFPFKIQYRVNPEDPWTDLTNLDSDDHYVPTVKYQNSTQKVNFARSYTPPNNSGTTYENVYFLTPGRSLDIDFPYNALYYRVCECSVDPSIYDVKPGFGVLTDVDGNTIVQSGTIKDLYSQSAVVKEQPTIKFENRLDTENIRYLDIKKKLYSTSEKGEENEITDDDTKFTFRLYLSNGTGGKLELAELRKYYVLDPSLNYCKWQNGSFVSLGKSDITAMSEEELRAASFYTSTNGSISNIPAGYTVRVPGLVVGSKFMVDERDYEIPVGYKLIDFECNMGSRTNEQGETENIPSYDIDRQYTTTDSGEMKDAVENSAGTIKAGCNASMNVSNQKGFGLKAEKLWSDKDFAAYHGDIFVAVYVKGELRADSVRKISSPATSVTYFFDSLEPGTTIDDYKIFEVEVDGSNNVTRKLAESDQLTAEAGYGDGDGEHEPADYVVSYPAPTEISDIARGQQIRNTRKGGIAVNLYKWYTDTDKDTPLPGGTFALYKGEGDAKKKIGTFTSDSSGNITVICGFDEGDVYTIEQTKAPTGYKGLSSPISFTVTKTDSDYGIGNWSNPNDDEYYLSDGETRENDADREDGRNWSEYTVFAAGADETLAVIDIYNPGFELTAVKVDSGSSSTKLSGAVFSLHRTITTVFGTGKDANPISGYESLTTDANGVIPRIDNTLPAGTYYLEEETPPSGYEPLEEDIVFTISEGGIVTMNKASQSGYLKHENGAYTISIPNTRTSSDYYFDIEKIIFVDKNIHDSDPEQKFVFKVERFAEDAETLTTPLETFYVTLNCKNKLDAYPYDDLQNTEKYSLDSSENKVTVTYNSGETYTFPAAVMQGKQTVHAAKNGIYRVSEVSKWSSTDYDFWSGSNAYKGYGTAKRQKQSDGYVIFSASDVKADSFKNETAEIGGETEHRPTASFTNTETEYAYLSSQAYAENTIKRKTGQEASP